MNVSRRAADRTEPASVMLIVPAVGEIREEPLPAGQDLIARLRDRIGCDWVEAIDITIDGQLVTVWCDEEGLLKAALLVNLAASRLLARGGVARPTVVGAVVITGGPDRDGETDGLSTQRARHITDLISTPRTTVNDEATGRR